MWNTRTSLRLAFELRPAVYRADRPTREEKATDFPQIFPHTCHALRESLAGGEHAVEGAREDARGDGAKGRNALSRALHLATAFLRIGMGRWGARVFLEEGCLLYPPQHVSDLRAA